MAITGFTAICILGLDLLIYAPLRRIYGDNRSALARQVAALRQQLLHVPRRLTNDRSLRLHSGEHPVAKNKPRDTKTRVSRETICVTRHSLVLTQKSRKNQSRSPKQEVGGSDSYLPRNDDGLSFVTPRLMLGNNCLFLRGCLALAFLVVVLPGTVPLRGQTASDSEETISTDRPAVANSSVVVPKSGLQLESGLLITNTQGQHILDLPETSLRFGLLNKTEVRLSVPDYFRDLPTGTSATSGFGDIALGVKQQFGPLRRNFDLSLIVFLSLPTGTQAVSSHGYDPGLQVPWTYKLSEN